MQLKYYTYILLRPLPLTKHVISFIVPTPAFPRSSILVIPASLAFIIRIGCVPFFSLEKPYQHSLRFVLQSPSNCINLSLNVLQNSVPNSTSYCISGTALKSIRLSIPSISRVTGRIPAISHIILSNARIRDVFGSRRAAKRLPSVGLISKHVAPGSKRARYGLPSNSMVR